MTATIDHKPPEVTVTAAESGTVTDYWTAALKYYATGITAESIRVQASWDWWVSGLAYVDGVTPEAEREGILAIAGCMDAIEAAGLTREQAYFLAGLDRVLGVPFSEFNPASLSAA